MDRLFYWILYGFSLLPMKLLYVFSDVFYFLINYVIRYRRKVISENLRNSFPEKSVAEIKRIQKQFYKNFADFLIETLKGFSIKQEELDRRFTYSNLEVFEECRKEGHDVILMTGHVFNWEWFNGLAKNPKMRETIAVYHKIKSPFWNEKINDIRSKSGTTPIDMKDIGRFMMKAENNGDRVYFFVADQSPKQSMVKHNIHFLNQETPVFAGFDKIAIRKNMAVVFCKTTKIKQGYYHTEFERILPDHKSFEKMEVVEKFFEKLEKLIIEHPDNWLWSHKRWKFKKGIDY